jgi:hypothetical protein
LGDLGRDLALALLERVEALGRRDRRGLGLAHAVDDAGVLLRHALHELGPLEQVREAVGLEDHGHDVRVVGLIERHQPRAQRDACLRQPCAQLDEADALAPQRVLDARELGALLREIGLDPVLARLQRRDAALQHVDPLRVARDRRRQHALVPLLGGDLALLGVDPARQRRAGGQHGHEQPQHERHRGRRDQEAQSMHPARHARRRLPVPPQNGRSLWNVQRPVQDAGLFPVPPYARTAR